MAKRRFIPEPRKIKLLEPQMYSNNLGRLRKLYGSDVEIRREYRRLQAAIDKRLKRLQKAGFGDSYQARELARLPRIGQLKDMGQVALKLNLAYRRLSDPRYTLPGAREARNKASATMVSKGMILPTAGASSGEEINTLFAVARSRGYLPILTSERILEIYRKRQEKGEDTDLDADEWGEVLEDLAEKIQAIEVEA